MSATRKVGSVYAQGGGMHGHGTQLVSVNREREDESRDSVELRRVDGEVDEVEDRDYSSRRWGGVILKRKK